MYKLLVEFPDGNQNVIDIDATGSFFDPTKVLWDERVNGPLPNDIELGKMELINGQLVNRGSYIDGHQEYIQAEEQSNIADNVAQLWAAADAYIYSEINGVALSMLSLGVSQDKPKAKAVAAWCDSVWAEYYARKALITVISQPDLDFSSLGGKPHTVLELREEVYPSWVGQP